jgi:hypothetical protein
MNLINNPTTERPYKLKVLNKMENQFLKTYPKTYEYEQRTYSISPYQLKILNYIKTLPQRNLHYLVGQQSNKHRNLTLKEMKKLIRDGIRRHIQGTTLPYCPGLENQLVKYFCVFETTKDFYLSQNQNTIVDSDIDMGLHFHLFITSPDNYPWVSFPSLFYTLFDELTHLPQNKRCISKYDYDRLKDLNENFVLYHTKQFKDYPSSEMIMKNY